jgi:hypothetical protein
MVCMHEQLLWCETGNDDPDPKPRWLSKTGAPRTKERQCCGLGRQPGATISLTSQHKLGTHTCRKLNRRECLTAQQLQHF